MGIHQAHAQRQAMTRGNDPTMPSNGSTSGDGRGGDHGFPAEREALTRRLFPDGVPTLWSPTLTFYDEDGRIDRGRQLAHLAFMAPHVRGLLVPGSTGDAWEMDDDEA